ncbi:MAG: hypothetical protein LBV46_03900, partial [Bacteroidales bacterium]|nr:hypothetical protein [Bacteroidales bacterium]
MKKETVSTEKLTVVEDAQTKNQSYNELINMRKNQLENLSTEAQKELHPLQQVYTKDKILPDVLKYFEGDALAADVWIDKYALKNESGQLLEKTPDEMHR